MIGETQQRHRVFGMPHWEGSIILWLACFVVFGLQWVYPLTHVARCRSRKGLLDDYGDSLPMWLVDAWVLFLFTVQLLVLFFLNTASPLWNVVAAAVAAYGLGDVFRTTLDDFVNVDRKDGRKFIEIRDPSRWLLMAPLSLFQTITCFAILVLLCGCSFEDKLGQPIADPLTALYFATVTLSTLGYGDYSPKSGDSRLLVVAHVAFFVGLVAVKITIAAAALNVQEKTPNAQ